MFLNTTNQELYRKELKLNMDLHTKGCSFRNKMQVIIEKSNNNILFKNS